MDLIDIYRTFRTKTREYTFFSSAHGALSRIDHILGHKSSLSKFKKIEIVSSIFSDHNTMRLDITYREKTIKNTNTWGFTGGAVVKNPPANAGDTGLSPGLEEPTCHGAAKPVHHSN